MFRVSLMIVNSVPSFTEDLTVASESEKIDGQKGVLQDDNLVEKEVEAINQATSSKVSTGCGPSPPPDSTNQKEEENNAKKMVSTSIGTSPPPQNISTQVCVLSYLFSVEKLSSLLMIFI